MAVLKRSPKIRNGSKKTIKDFNERLIPKSTDFTGKGIHACEIAMIAMSAKRIKGILRNIIILHFDFVKKFFECIGTIEIYRPLPVVVVVETTVLMC